MKIYRGLGLAALLAIPAFALGENSIPSGALGQVEATISFCAKVDSSSAEQYKEWGKRIVAGIKEKELKEIRDSSEYKESYDSSTSQLDKIPAEKAVQTCRAALSDSGK